jgi:quercetin dioxygenase-like cupin family protein
VGPGHRSSPGAGADRLDLTRTGARSADGAPISTARRMRRHDVARVDWSFTAKPLPTSPNMKGLARTVLVGPAQGAVHSELAVAAFAPGGWLLRHVHAFEESLYVLAGELLLELEGAALRLVPGDFALIPIGHWHAFGNAGQEETRFLSFGTPQRLAPDAGRRDTFFAAEPLRLGALARRARRPPFGSPTLRLVGHDQGTLPRADAQRPDERARGRKPAGSGTAPLANSGISVTMLIDRAFGADLMTMFTIEAEIGGAVQAHDHPFEETYFLLAGRVEAEIEGQAYALGPGDVAFAGVGAVHGFRNSGPERVRWIETQAPQPPARHAHRSLNVWEQLAERAAR